MEIFGMGGRGARGKEEGAGKRVKEEPKWHAKPLKKSRVDFPSQTESGAVKV
jgi:hypothetical protein